MDIADEMELIKGDYEALIKEHGTNRPESVGWSDSAGQLRRYEVLLTTPDHRDNHGKLLEVGCGNGGLFRLSQRLLGRYESYTGIDMVEEHIKVASTKHEHGNMQWICDDAIPFLSNTNRKWDTVIASGVLARYNAHLARHLLNLMYYVTAPDGVMAFNWSRLTCGITDRDMLTILSDIGVRGYVLRNDYIPNDFTVLAYK